MVIKNNWGQSNVINLGILSELKLDVTFIYYLQIQKLQILIILIASI